MGGEIFLRDVSPVSRGRFPPPAPVNVVWVLPVANPSGRVGGRMVSPFQRRDVKNTFPSANADPVRAADSIAGNYNGNKLFALCVRPCSVDGRLLRSSCADCWFQQGKRKTQKYFRSLKIILELGRWAGCFAESCSLLVRVQPCGPRKGLLGGVKPCLVLASLRTCCRSLGAGGVQEPPLDFGFCARWVRLLRT